MAESKPIVILTKKTEQLELNHRRQMKAPSREGLDSSKIHSDSSTSTMDAPNRRTIVVSDNSKRMNSIRKIEDRSKIPPQSRNQNYQCHLCSSTLRDEHSVTDHIKSNFHMERLEEKYSNTIIRCLPDATSTQLSAMTKMVEQLHGQYSAHKQDDVRLEVVQELDTLIKPVIKNGFVELFGSSGMKCALKSSDINLNVNIEDTDISNNDIPEMFINILKILKDQGKAVYHRVHEDFYSPFKIPRILFKHSASQLHCELRIGSFAPCQTSALVALYNQLDQRVSKLCVAMKHWAKVFDVDSAIDGHYPAVVFVVMVIHYLQQTTPPVLPVLHEEVTKLSNDHGSGDDESDNEDGRGTLDLEPEYHQLESAAKEWKCSNYNNDSLGELLYGLFKYYVIEFDHRKHAVSIRSSTPILRSTRDGWGSHRLAVEDPFLTKNNISKAAGSDKVYEFLFKSLRVTYFYLLRVNKKLCNLVKGIAMGAIEELPEVDLTEMEREEVEEDSESEKEDNKESSKTTDENPSGSRNITEEVFAECSDEVKDAVGKKAARTKRYRAQILKVLNDMIVEEENQDYSFDKEHFRNHLKNYPVACICCKRARHVAKECPDEIIPKLHGSVYFPQIEHIRCFDQVLVEYMTNVMLRPPEERAREDIRRQILGDIHNLYPKASLELFGSSANMFGHRNSDLDLCLMMNEDYQCEKIEIIEEIAKHLKKKALYRGVSWIRSARVPIIKLSIERWNLDCDISMENRLALQNTRMLAMYATIDSRVRILGYTVKYFAKRCDMCDASSGSISSYAYILMIIHFLQYCNILPVLQKLSLNPRKTLPTEPIVEGWNCYFFDQIQRLHEVWKPADVRLSGAELWLNFLLYYSNDFDWKHNVVTIRQSEPLDKFKKSWTSKPMAIEDPFNLDHNLAQAITARMRFYIIKRFHKAVQHHTKQKYWRKIDEVMDQHVLCGEYRAPKFMICDKCNKRGHKAADCKKEIKLESDQTEDSQKPLHTDHGNKDKKRSNRYKSNSEGKETSGEELKDKPNSLNPEPKYETDSSKDGNEIDGIKSSSKIGKEVVQSGARNKNGNESLNEVDGSNSSDVRKTRSQLREELMKETKGDCDQLKTIHRQLKTQTRSGKSTSSDKRRLHACGDLLKKLQKQQVYVQVHQDDDEDEYEGEKDRQQQHGISMDNTRSYSSSKESPPVTTKQRAKSENTVMAKPDNSHHRGGGGGAGGSEGGILSTPIPPLVASPIIRQHLPQHPVLPQSSFPLGPLPRHGTSYPHPPPPLSSNMPHPLQQPPGVRPNNPSLGNYPNTIQAGDSPLLATPPSPQQVYPSQPHGYR